MAAPLTGLKMLRQNTSDKTPQYNCDNCKCNRYSKCGCQRKTSKKGK